MYAVATRTMANAKPKFRDPDSLPITRTIEQIRRDKMAERMALVERDSLVIELRREIAIRDAKITRLEHKLSTRAQGSVLDSDYDRIERRLSKIFGYSRLDIRSERGSKELSFARQCIAYWARRRTVLSLKQIGGHQRRDHTSILHGIRAYREKRAAMGRYLRPVR